MNLPCSSRSGWDTYKGIRRLGNTHLAAKKLRPLVVFAAAVLDVEYG